MKPLSLSSVESAFRSAFSVDLCAEDDLPFWSEDNPSRGHCAIAALTINDLFGGDLLVAEVFRDGHKTGYHCWNRLSGLDVDLTRDQFSDNETVGSPDVVKRPEGRPKQYADQYDIFRARVLAALGVT